MSDPAVAWPAGHGAGRQAWEGALWQAVRAAGQMPGLSMCWSDPDFAQWPLGERAWIEVLDDWAQAGGRLRMIAADYRDLRQRHPRFVSWRQRWAHRVQPRSLGRARTAETPALLVCRGGLVECLDPVRLGFVASTDPMARVRLQQGFDEWWQQAVPALPVTTLGL